MSLSDRGKLVQNSSPQTAELSFCTIIWPLMMQIALLQVLMYNISRISTLCCVNYKNWLSYGGWQWQLNNKVPLIEVRPTTLAWSMTLTLTYTLTFNPPQTMIMVYSHAKVQGQQSVSSKDRVETNGRMDGQTYRGDCINSLANAVGKDNCNYY